VPDDFDLDALKIFYQQVIMDRATMALQNLKPQDMIVSYAQTESFFAEDLARYHRSELEAAKQDEARVGVYLNGGFTGEQWPEDFEPMEETP
jgi:hypothetical protein